MPQITLIGVTGPSGKPLIEKVLALQYTIVIYARNPQKLDDALKADSRVRIVKGTLDDTSNIRQAVEGSIAVISVLSSGDSLPFWLGGGPPKGIRAVSMSECYDNILSAMAESGVNRFLAIGTPSYGDPLDKFSLLMTFIITIARIIIPRVVADVRSSHKVLLKWQDKIDWSWFRVALVHNTPATGYKTGYLGDNARFTVPRIGREDMAQCLLDELKDPKWNHKSPFLWE